MSKRPNDVIFEEGIISNGGKVPRLEETANGLQGVPATAGATQRAAVRPPGRALKELSQLYRKEQYQVEVVVPAEQMTGSNKQVKERQLWGDGEYTEDSDLVAVLMHLGYYAASTGPPPPQVQEFHAALQLLPPRPAYASCFRNSVRSRAWAAQGEGCAYRVERVWIMTRSGLSVPLAPSAVAGAGAPGTPTFAPSGGDRQMATRSNAGAAGRPRPKHEVTVLYNLCNEPWSKYSLGAVADRGLRPRQWTSVRLRSEVLMLETETERFQVAFAGVMGEGATAQDSYTLYRCKRALPLDMMWRLGLPLIGPEHVDVLEEQLAWEELEWGVLSLMVRGKEFKVIRLHFLKACPPKA